MRAMAQKLRRGRFLATRRKATGPPDALKILLASAKNNLPYWTCYGAFEIFWWIRLPSGGAGQIGIREESCLSC
jgi:hypothetical protein